MISARNGLPPDLRLIDEIAYIGAFIMIGVALAYLLLMILATHGLPAFEQRERPARRRSAPDAEPLHLIVLMPCLNEAAVIRPSVERLLANPDPHFRIVVIDDGSEDGTSEMVGSIDDPRVGVMRREPPNARLGKGDALNEALGLVREIYSETDPSRVVVGVMDADGHLDRTAWDVVRERFSHEEIGALQLGVRIANRGTSLLARMQDMEFVTFTSLFQVGRRFFGSVGMGGNAQFVRLAALDALGERPWSDSLTEDFDLGIRLNATRWTNDFSGLASVHQEGVTNMRRFLRQRTRWFQGNLQARSLLGLVITRLRGKARADTLYQVLSPYLLLVGSFLTFSFLIALGVSLANLITGTPQSWAWVPTAYLLAFGPGYVYAHAYWKVVRSEGSGLIRCVLWSHLFVLYGLLTGVYGWRALVREALGRSGWAKTAREAEPAAAAIEAGAPAEGIAPGAPLRGIEAAPAGAEGEGDPLRAIVQAGGVREGAAQTTDNP